MTSNNFTECNVLEQIAMPQIKTVDTIKQSELERSDSGSKRDNKRDDCYEETNNEPTT